jgi:ferredoxin
MKMSWTVDDDLCTGCELCCEKEEFFRFNEAKGKAEIIKPKAPKDQPDCVEASEDCPTEAIQWVD